MLVGSGLGVRLGGRGVGQLTDGAARETLAGRVAAADSIAFRLAR